MAKKRTRVVTRVIRRRGGRRRGGFTLPLAAVAGFLPMALDVYEVGYQGYGPGHRLKGVGERLLVNLTGYNRSPITSGENWEFGTFARGTGSILLGLMVHKFVGGKLGVNRMLARAGVPFLRV